MGRFRISTIDDNENESEHDDTLDSNRRNNNYFRSHHVYSSSSDEDNEKSGIWSPTNNVLMQLTRHCPQNENYNEMDESGRARAGYLNIPSVTIRKQRREEEPPSAMNACASSSSSDNNNVRHDQRNLHYYEYPYNDTPPRPRSIWFRVILMAFVAHLLARYGPVAPPRETGELSWEDFWVRELRGLWRTTKLVGWTVPKYVAEWVAVGVWDDVRYYYGKYQTYRLEQADLALWANCSLNIPEEWHLFDDNVDNNNQLYRIVGQHRAVQVTTQALDAWERSAPLLLYFAGSRGVGKTELARQISRRVFGNCNSTNYHDERDDHLFKGSGSPVLILQGRDYLGDTEMVSPPTAVHEDDFDLAAGEKNHQDETNDRPATSIAGNGRAATRSIRLQFYETIIRHAERHPNGTVVILRHAEDIADGLFATFVQDLTQPSRHISTQDRLDHQRNHDGSTPSLSLASRLQQACRKTIIMVTSNVGSRTIANSIRGYGGSNVPPLELDLMLMHEMDTHFVVDETETSVGDDRSRKRLQASIKEVGSNFHAVAPFYPLVQASLQRILQQKMHNWFKQQPLLNLTLSPSLEPSAAFLEAFFDSSRVEYLTVLKRSTQTPLLTFSSVGAQFLREGSSVMNGWKSSVKKCFRGILAAGATRGDVNMDVTGVTEPLESNSNQAVLHYDSEREIALILFCPPAVTRKEIDQDEFSASGCEKKCHFAL